VREAEVACPSQETLISRRSLFAGYWRGSSMNALDSGWLTGHSEVMRLLDLCVRALLRNSIEPEIFVLYIRRPVSEKNGAGGGNRNIHVY
jgi:hypothetical protein